MSQEFCLLINVVFVGAILWSVWETLAQRRFVARICGLFKAYAGKGAWKAVGDRFLKPCYRVGGS